jgi:hypothetical protein
MEWKSNWEPPSPVTRLQLRFRRFVMVWAGPALIVFGVYKAGRAWGWF